MLFRYLKPFLLGALMLLHAGCDNSGDELRPRAVIEGWLDSEGYPTVIFTASFVVGEENVAISDKVIRWGKVTISDGTRTVIMTGGPDRDLFPPYRYYTYDMKGEPGKTYTIEAEFDDFHATATATMPYPPVVSSVDVTPSEVCDTLRSVIVNIVAPEKCPAFYHVSTRVVPEDTRFYPAVLGCIKAETPGEIVRLQVFRGKTSLTSADFTPQLPSNRVVLIKIERVTQEVYDFWNAFDEAALFGGSQFVGHSASLPSNIEGGFGYWSPQGVTLVRIPE